MAANVAERLFPIEDPLGRSIRVENLYYVVIGIVKDRAPSAGIGGSLTAQDFSNDVYIPLSDLWARIGETVVTRRSGSFEGETLELNQITLRIRSVAAVISSASATRIDMRRSPD